MESRKAWRDNERRSCTAVPLPSKSTIFASISGATCSAYCSILNWVPSVSLICLIISVIPCVSFWSFSPQKVTSSGDIPVFISNARVNSCLSCNLFQADWNSSHLLAAWPQEHQLNYHCLIRSILACLRIHLCCSRKTLQVINSRGQFIVLNYLLWREILDLSYRVHRLIWCLLILPWAGCLPMLDVASRERPMALQPKL